MKEFLGLLVEDLGESGMAMPDIDCRNPTNQVKELLVLVVVQVLHIPFDGIEWILVIWLVEWEQIVLVPVHGLLLG